MVESFKVVTVDPPQNILLRLLRTKTRGVVGRSRPAYRLRGPRPLVPPPAIGSLPNGFELRFERFRSPCLHTMERKHTRGRSADSLRLALWEEWSKDGPRADTGIWLTRVRSNRTDAAPIAAEPRELNRASRVAVESQSALKCSES